jgi:hypothetical protein
MKFVFSRHTFEKVSNIKFYQNPSSGSRVVPCRQTDGRTDDMKLIVAFRNFANASKNSNIKFSPNPFSESRVPCGRTDVHDET